MDNTHYPIVCEATCPLVRERHTYYVTSAEYDACLTLAEETEENHQSPEMNAAREVWMRASKREHANLTRLVAKMTA